jgi:hypothetical protein
VFPGLSAGEIERIAAEVDSFEPEGTRQAKELTAA